MSGEETKTQERMDGKKETTSLKPETGKRKDGRLPLSL